jgi:hypothetical protein
MTSETRSPAPNTSARRKPAQSARQPIDLELARSLCPIGRVATAVAHTFGLPQVDGDAVTDETDAHLRAMADALAVTLSERQLSIHMQRITQAFVASAFGAGQFYSNKISEARLLTDRLANDDRDEDRGGPIGFESRAERAREFAARACVQAFALMAAADGAARAFEHITGETWKPYVAPIDDARPLARKAADLEMGSFG